MPSRGSRARHPHRDLAAIGDQQRPRSNTSGAQSAGDDHLLDLVGALADRQDLRVAVEPADRVLLDVAVAAVDLNRLLGGADGEATVFSLA